MGLGPNQSGFVYQRNPGVFKTKFRTNSRGMRDREYPSSKGSNLRILVLGDSFTEGWGVEEQQAYPKVLESRFLQGVEVWNLGVVGFSTDQELQLLTNAEELRSQKMPEQRYISSTRHRASNLLMQSAMIRLVRFAIAKVWYLMRMAGRAMELQLMVWERNNTYRPVESPEMKEAWSITERVLYEINSLCRRNDAKFVLVYIPRQ